MSACSAIATFLAGRKLSRIGIDSDTSSMQHRRRTGEHLGALDLEVVGRQPHRRARALTPDRVLHRLLHVEVERVAELVGLVLVRALVADAGALDARDGRRGPSSACGTGRRAPCWPMARIARGVSSSRPSRCSMSPASSSIFAELARAGRASGRRRRRAARGRGRGRPRRARRAGWPTAAGSRASSRSPSVSSRPGICAELQRVVAAEVLRALPRHVRERLLQVARQLVDLPAQVHVLEQRLGERLELRALLGRHRVEQLLHLRHRLRHLLEQLVEALRVAGEEVAVALHEARRSRAPRRARAARASG